MSAVSIPTPTIATQAPGNLPRLASLSAQEHDLRAPYGERVRGTQARLKPGALLSTRLADEDGWMHAQQMRSSIRSHKRSDEDALGASADDPAADALVFAALPSASWPRTAARHRRRQATAIQVQALPDRLLSYRPRRGADRGRTALPLRGHRPDREIRVGPVAGEGHTPR